MMVVSEDRALLRHHINQLSTALEEKWRPPLLPWRRPGTSWGTRLLFEALAC